MSGHGPKNDCIKSFAYIIIAPCMEDLILELSIVLVGTAVMSFIAVFLKQPIFIAYILCGVLVAAWGGEWVRHATLIEGMSHLGITLLLFLAGLCLHPQKLIRLFRKTVLVTLAGSVSSFAMAFVFAFLWGFSLIDSLCIGLALMFSSTILVVKLLPTTKLHHEKMGAVCIGILILQDLMAVAVLAFVRCLGSAQGVFLSFAALSAKLSVFIVVLIALENFVLRKMMLRADRLHEVLFVLGLAWCFGIASISNKMGLFYETGAFFAGVVLARHPIALFISEKLKPLRDFFLVLFFFTLGAKLDFLVMKHIVVPALLLAALFVLVKPALFRHFLVLAGEPPAFAKEAGVRLGQLSEFSLLVAFLALELGHIGKPASQFIQLVTIMTFVASSYIVVFKYSTPIGVSDKLIKD